MDWTQVLNGKLTYCAGFAFILVGIYQFGTALIQSTQGQPADFNTGVQNILGGIAILGGRRAIGKISGIN